MCVCVNLRHSTIRKWHYGNVGITMKRAASSMLRATFYIQRLISQATAFAPVYPIYESPLNLQPLHLISPLSASSPSSPSVKSSSFFLPCINCFPPGPCSAQFIIQTSTADQLITSNCREQLTSVHLLYSVQEEESLQSQGGRRWCREGYRKEEQGGNKRNKR